MVDSLPPIIGSATATSLCTYLTTLLVSRIDFRVLRYDITNPSHFREARQFAQEVARLSRDKSMAILVGKYDLKTFEPFVSILINFCYWIKRLKAIAKASGRLPPKMERRWWNHSTTSCNLLLSKPVP